MLDVRNQPAQPSPVSCRDFSEDNLHGMVLDDRSVDLGGEAEGATVFHRAGHPSKSIGANMTEKDNVERRSRRFYRTNDPLGEDSGATDNGPSEQKLLLLRECHARRAASRHLPPEFSSFGGGT